MTEDIRNGNGRAIKSKLWSPNRVDKINAPVNAIFWIMKDPTIPPVVKLKGASLASVMGATLATKRSSAERLAPGVDPNKLVVVPYANPFRTYPLANDYEKFKKLVEEKHVDCYIVNTGDFMGKKVQKEDTLGILEAIVEKRADFHQWGPFSDIEIMDWEGFVPDMQDKNYTDQLKARMNDRVDEIKAFATEKEGYDKLPDDALAVIVWIAGGLVGLKGITHILAAVLLTALAVGLAVFLIRSSGGRKGRMKQLKADMDRLENEQQAILDKYQIEDIHELMEKSQNQRSRQDVVLRLRRELEQLRKRYDELQKPLAPYLEKYGDSVTLESAAGQEQKQKLQKLRGQASELLRQSEQLNWQLEQLNMKQSELSELEEQLKVLDADRKMSEEDMQAIDISMNAITEMTARIHGSFGLQLADYISQLFSYISNGAHKKLNIDEKFQVTVDDDRKLLQPQQLSAGTADQIYFSVRMAVSQMLYDEPMPLILDDSFVLYDDERLKNTLRWLTEQKAFSQILIFTCHHREAEMLESLNCDYHYVEL